MYLRRLRVQHLKLLRDVTLDFTNEDGSIRMWTVVIGQNGTGKSSLLQAIAIAAAGRRQVSVLVRRIVGHLRDIRAQMPMQIEAEFAFEENEASAHWHPTHEERSRAPSRLLSLARLDPGENSIDAMSYYIPGDAGPKDPLDVARSRNTAHWFVVGYGVARFVPDVERTVKFDVPSVERMLPLFDPTIALTSTNFSREFREGTEKARRFHRVLQHAMLNVKTLLPDIVGLQLRGRGGVTRPGDLMERDRFKQKIGNTTLDVSGLALAHGYQSTIAWLADLVGHVLLEADDEVEPEFMQGVVLVDEIDLYLHPVWQATLIPALRRTFPLLQFIVTTHSPVVLSGVAPHEVVRLASYGDEGDVVEVVHHPETGELVPAAELRGAGIRPDPRMMTGTELYREHFGLLDPTPNPLGDELRRYTAIANDPFRTDEEHADLLRLRAVLKEHEIEDLPKVLRRRKA